jgi:ribosomal protein S12 methylthiotransferase
VAVRRRNTLLELQRQISLERNQSLIGSQVRVLLEEREGRKFVGRGFADAPEVDQRIVCKGTNLHLNDFADVTITGCTEYELQSC